MGELARRLKYYRRIHRMSVRDLAGKANVSVSYIYAIEAGARGSNVTKLGQIAHALGVKLDDLWGEQHHEG